MGEKEECLTYTTGAVEVRQTAHEMTIINHGTEPIKVTFMTSSTIDLIVDAGSLKQALEQAIHGNHEASQE